MKKFFLVLVIISFVSKRYEVSAQSNGKGLVYYNAPYAGVDRYLSRAIFGVYLNDYKGTSGSGTYGNVYHDFKEMCSDLSASLISRATLMWGWEGRMVPGTQFYIDMTQLVDEINKSYDTKNKFRPLVEAAIMEHITKEVNAVPIPNWVKQEFCIRYPNECTLINSKNNFDHSEIAYAPNSELMDISKIEAKMWVYYLARTYIDYGYSCLHLGALDAYCQNDQQYEHISSCVKMIRAYARSKDAFLLINVDVNKEIYEYNSGNSRYIFDFICSPLRPEGSLNQYATQPCAQLKNVELAFYKKHYMPALLSSNGGISPQGDWMDKLPVLFNLDWNGWTSDLGQIIHAGWFPWGYDEMGWFDQLLTDDCRAYLIKNFSYAIKNDLMHRAYFKMPGIEPTMNPAKQGFNDNFSVLSHPTIVKAIEQAWGIDQNEYYTQAISCKEVYNKEGQRELGIELELKVTNPDATSIYTWHIKSQSNGWLPYTMGNIRKIILPEGEYQVYLRRDNLALDPFDVKELIKTIDIKLADIPCDGGESTNKSKHYYIKHNNKHMQLELDKESLIRNNGNISIYPNPTNGLIRINALNSIINNINKIEIIDLNGKVILVQSFSDRHFKNNLDISFLSSGVYLCNIYSGSDLYSIKLLKQ